MTFMMFNFILPLPPGFSLFCLNVFVLQVVMSYIVVVFQGRFVHAVGDYLVTTITVIFGMLT